MSALINIPATANEQRFAVQSKLNSTIILIAPNKSYCDSYCERENIANGNNLYHVVTYNGPIKSFLKKVPEFNNNKKNFYNLDVYKNESLYSIAEKIIGIKKTSIKDKIAKYLQKKS